MIGFCLACGLTAPFHQPGARCATFVAPTRAALVHRLRVMAVDALSSNGRPPRSRVEAQVLIAAARLLEHPETSEVEP